MILLGERYHSVGESLLPLCSSDAELDLLGVSLTCAKEPRCAGMLAYENNATTSSVCWQMSLQALALSVLDRKHLLNKVCLEYPDVRANVCDCGQDHCDTIIQAGLSSFTETDLPNGV